MEVLRFRFLAGTYDQASVASLQATKSILDAEMRKQEQLLVSHQDALREYKQTGEGFGGLVKEYATLLSKIETTEWNVSKMGKT
jgi:hypothetical protein